MTPITPPTAVLAPAAQVRAIGLTLNPDGTVTISWQVFAANGTLLLANASKLTALQAASILASGTGALAAAETYMAAAIVSGTIPPSATLI